MPSLVRTVNNQSLRELGALLRFVNRRSAPTRNLPATAIATRFGGMHGVPTFQPRPLRASGWIAPAARTRVALTNALTALEELVYQGPVVVRVSEPGGQVREITGTTTSWDPVTSTTMAATVEWELSCEDPTWRSYAPEWIPLPAAAAVAIPCGTAAGGWLATIAGQPSDPFTLTFRKASGELITTMTFDYPSALAANEYLIVDGGAMTVQKVTAGAAAADAITGLSGNFPPRGINPEDAWRAGASYPTVQLSSGTGMLFTLPRWLG